MEFSAENWVILLHNGILDFLLKLWLLLFYENETQTENFVFIMP